MKFVNQKELDATDTTKLTGDEYSQQNSINSNAIKNKVRPIPIISDFVVEELPYAIIKYDKEYSVLIEKGMQYCSIDFLHQLSESDREVAILDLTLLNQVDYQNKLVLNPEFKKNYQLICNYYNRLATMLYEDCVLTNPLEEDPRLFLTEEARGSEYIFLHTHTLIEKKLVLAISAALNILEIINKNLAGINHLSEKNHQFIINELAIIDNAVKEISELFIDLNSIPKAHFNLFREFYLPPPKSEFLGPSGRFSAKSFSLRMLIEGRALLSKIPEFFDEIIKTYAYFPKDDRELMVSLFEPGCFMHPENVSHEIIDLIAKRHRHEVNCLSHAKLNDTEHEILMSIRKYLDRIIATHLALARKYIVEN